MSYYQTKQVSNKDILFNDLILKAAWFQSQNYNKVKLILS